MSEPNTPVGVIFDAAIELPPERRAAYLREACGDDDSLRQRVEALLRAHESAEAFMNHPTVDLSEETVVVKPAEQPGDRIGRYKLLQQIGEGGCGVVYMAEQAEPVHRRVALKVIKLGMDTKNVIARFEAERQALALMDHPNIAKVLDGGATESGRPFFVMELVKGVRITDYCDKNNLSTTERLGLFIQVCQAIQHAHQKGIIHRDIKPSNILVTLHDGVPVPKVIDFGIAKATTDQRLTDKTLYTAIEQFIGTPAYMSPEQAELSGLDIDTRSDIYALGVLLYELLTGKTPFDAQRLVAAGLDEIRRIIREEDPPRPSTRISTLDAAEQTAIAKRRHAEPPKLMGLIRGDVDWIVMKTLEKDRTRRYETANGLATDIQRHFNNEPVVARPPSNFYRFQKLVRRNKLVFAAGTAVIAALVLGLGFATWSLVQERKMRVRAETAEQDDLRLRMAADNSQKDARTQARLAEIAAAEAKMAFSTFNFLQACRCIAEDKDYDAVSYLVASLRANPANDAAATRLATLLAYRTWPRPILSLQHGGRVCSADFSPDGKRVVTASEDNTARVWDAQTGQPLTEPLKHAGGVISARFSPDGKRVLTASSDSTARVWDAQTGQPLTESLRHASRVWSAEFSPDGKRVVTSSDDKTARVWDARTGQPLAEPLKHAAGVFSAQFSPDGQRVVTASYSTAQVWDAQTGQPLTEPFKHAGLVSSARFSPDGKRVLTASSDSTARVWDAQTGQPLTEPLKHSGQVRSAQFTSDGKRVVTASWDRTARVWDAQTGQPVTEPLKHTEGVYSAQFSPDGKRVLTASEDNTARVWDARTGQPLTEPLKHGGPVNSAQFSPDGKRIVTASGDNTAQVWDAQTGQPLTEPLKHTAGVHSAHFSPDGKRIVTLSLDNTARVWDAQTGQPLTEPLKHGGRVNSAQLSPDGKRVVTASQDKTAQVWDAQTGQPLAEPLKHASAVISAQFSPDGKRVVTASEAYSGGAARVWDAQTGQPLTEPLKHANEVTSAEFSSDGKRVVTASQDNTARVWDAQTGQPLTEPLKHASPVSCAQFSPDGKRVVTASGEGARVWDAQTGQPLTEPLRHAGFVSSAQFSPDGKWVVTASRDSTARVWDAQTGQPLIEPIRHADQVHSAEFSSDGKRVVTASRDSTARVWDARTGQPLTEPLKHGGVVHSARFSPDGLRVVTASDDKTARVWDAQTGQPLTEPLKHGGVVHSARFSPDGLRVVTASDDKTARVWDAQTGQPLTEPLRHAGLVYSGQFSPDGKRVVTASAYGNTGAARVWDAQTGQPLTEPLQHAGWVASAQFSPDGTQVVTAWGGYNGGSARVWDAQTGQPLTEPLKHAGLVFSAQFSPDGKRVVTVLGEGARVWDAQTGQPLTEPLRTSGWVKSAQLSSDGKRVVTVSGNGTRVRDAQTGKPLTEPLKHASAVISAQFSPDGKRVVTVSGEGARVWDAQTGQPLTEPLKLAGRVSSAQFSSDGKRVVTASNDGTARVWDAQTGQPLTEPLKHAGALYCAQFSPDGKWVVTAAAWPDNTARVWDVAPPPAGYPGWLLQLVTAVCGEVLSARGVLEYTNQVQAIDRLRQTLSQRAGNDDWLTLGRWLLADRSARTISPFSRITLAEWTERRFKENMTNSLAEVEQFAISIGDAVLLERVSQARSAVERAEAARALAQSANDAAWLCATFPREELRDGRIAVILAEKAVAATSRKDPAILDTLAASLAEAGRFAEAVLVQREALGLLSKDERLKEVYISHLKLYESNTPCRETDIEPLAGANDGRLVMAALLRTRGILCAQFAQWTLAAGCLTEVIALNLDENLNWFLLAPLLLETGDTDGYHKHCHAMLARFGTTNDPPIAGRTAKVCLLLPLDGADLAAATKLAETAVTLGKDDPRAAYYQFAKGLAEYRQANFAQAVEWTQKALSQPDTEYHRDIQAYSVLAMALSRLNRAGEAREALGKATELAGTKLPRLESGDLGPNWHNWIIAHTLLREAKALIEGQAATGGGQETAPKTKPRACAMSPKPSVEAIVEAALRLPPQQRAACVSDACGDDTPLRQRVEALIQEREQGGGVVDETTVLAGATALSFPPAKIPLAYKPGDKIGRYTLLEEIAEGGMGTVWKAEQTGPVRLTVALKVIKLGMDTKEVIARFERERQALALMDHANIAKVFDAGATDTGRPYFVMELVDGIPITRFCDEQNLSTTERLKLFGEVCHAIQHAHQKGVIHRDIKPSNILVSLQERTPVPKVIDFGIAKATDQRLTEKTLVTALDQIIGTPAYMSPEQAGLSGLDIDTRSDIYSLGVLLYELLTGKTPFDRKRLFEAGLEEIRRIIRQEEPPRPSTRISNLTAEEQTTTAKRRNTDPPRLLHLVRGDLDWIVMKCLEKDRTRRYETANGLAADLRRHLNNEPVVARPPSQVYRLQKLVRRNKLAFAAVTTVTASLILGLGLSTWLFLKERAARGEAVRAKQKEGEQRRQAEIAATEAKTALSTSDFLQACRFIAEQKGNHAVAYLVASLRANPTNDAAVTCLATLLAYRTWPRPIFEIQHGWAVQFSPDGNRIVTVSTNVAQVWDAQTSRPLTEPLRHAGRVDSAQFSPDGNRIVTVSTNVAQVWDVQTGQPLTESRRHAGRVDSAQFSPDGKRVVTASRGVAGPDGEARVWDAQTGQPLTEPLKHAASVNSAQFSPDGTRVVTASWDNTARVWDAQTGRPLTEPLKHAGRVLSAQFSPDGTRVVTASWDGTARVWDAQTGQPLTKPLKHARVFSAQFSPDGTQVVTASYDGTARVWDAQTGQPLTEPLKHAEQVNSAQFSPDGKRIVTASDDGTARVWNAQTGQPLTESLKHRKPVCSAQFSPDGKRVMTASADGTARVWETQTGQPLTEPLKHAGGVHFAQFSPDGKRVVTASVDSTARVWDAQTGQLLTEPLNHAAEFSFAQFSPDGKRIVTASWDNTARVWDAQTGRPLTEPLKHAGRVLSAQFSPDGTRVVTVSTNAARVWVVQTGQPLTEPLKHADFVNSAQFSPDGKRVVTASDDGMARVWDAKTGQPLTEPLKHAGGVHFAQFSRDGKRVVTAANDNMARVWDAQTGQPLSEPLQHAGPVFSAQFSPDGTRVVTASDDGTARVWDAPTGQPLTEPLKHAGGVHFAQFSPDGKRVVTAANDSMARVWDAQTGQPLSEPLQHAGPVFSAQFSPDGTRVVTASDDNTARVWDIAPPSASYPAWLLELATAVCGEVLSARGVLEYTNRPLDQVRQTLSEQPGNDDWLTLGRWLLAERSVRTISPFSKITVPEWIERRFKENMTNSLAELEQLAISSGDTALLERVSQAHLALEK